MVHGSNVEVPALPRSEHGVITAGLSLNGVQSLPRVGREHHHASNAALLVEGTLPASSRAERLRQRSLQVSEILSPPP